MSWYVDKVSICVVALTISRTSYDHSKHVNKLKSLQSTLNTEKNVNDFKNKLRIKLVDNKAQIFLLYTRVDDIYLHYLLFPASTSCIKS